MHRTKFKAQKGEYRYQFRTTNDLKFEVLLEKDFFVRLYEQIKGLQTCGLGRSELLRLLNGLGAAKLQELLTNDALLGKVDVRIVNEKKSTEKVIQ
ncbi:MAG: hypothetical protein Q7R96_04640 [Nanoarchaeota archaeon]|nr:hypothetical protein [Nanoarchaeota archaeon]